MFGLTPHAVSLSGRAAPAALFLRLAGAGLVIFPASIGLNVDKAIAEAAITTTLEIRTLEGSRKIIVEIADSPELQSRGLMFRQSLAPLHGMLFLYGPPREITMWMRNTYISLDMVFVMGDGRVHKIAPNTEPFSERLISSEGEVTAVLEISAGQAAALGIKVGDLVVHPHFEQ